MRAMALAGVPAVVAADDLAFEVRPPRPAADYVSKNDETACACPEYSPVDSHMRCHCGKDPAWHTVAAIRTWNAKTSARVNRR